MSSDIFYGQSSLIGPAGGVEEITPNDGTDLAVTTRALYVGGTGDVRVRTIFGTEATYKNVPAGTTILVRATRVLATGTTATFIVGQW